jgi:PKD repeat protein
MTVNRFPRAVPTLALCLAGAAAWALNPSFPPGSNFNLNNWKLQLPTSNGVLTAASGTVDEETPAQLTAGFTNTYFYTGSDGSMVFWAPDDGARTGGSTHPRSELREELVPGNDNVNWTVYGTHIMTAQCKVLQVPSDTEKVCIGQIHEPDTKPDGSASANNEQMIMFDLESLKIYVNINLDGDLSSSFSQTLISGSGVALSNTINYTMSMVNGELMIVVNNITNSWNLLSGTNYEGHIAQNWSIASSNTLYFKAGDYNQTTNTCNCATDGSRVAFYALTRYDAPSITNQPASQTVSVGSNVTFSVGALGSPPLGYAWLLNNTPINQATNAILTIPDAQLTNAGNYSVAVTDLTGGIVTSNPSATLTVLPAAPVASFTNNPASGPAPLTVNFYDTSTGSPTSWSWTFGDGIGTSAVQDPSYTYDYPGTYTVTQIVASAGGSSTNTGTISVSAYTFAQWQQFYGLTGTLSGANASYTGDGMSNTNKFLAGFSPVNPVAYLHIISIAPTNTTDVNVIYLGANGDDTYTPGIASRTNVLEFTAGTASGSYSNNFATTGQTNILSGGNGLGMVTNMVDVGGATNAPTRYYRIRVLVP